MTSGESGLITEVIAKTNGSLSVAPNVPGEIALLDIGRDQFYINDGAFLAMSGDASYHMSLQKLSGMFGGNSSGLFIMKTKGQGQVLINAFGSNQLPPTEVGGLFLSSVVKRLKADSLPKDSVLRPYTFYTVT